MTTDTTAPAGARTFRQLVDTLDLVAEQYCKETGEEASANNALAATTLLLYGGASPDALINAHVFAATALEVELNRSATVDNRLVTMINTIVEILERHLGYQYDGTIWRKDGEADR